MYSRVSNVIISTTMNSLKTSLVITVLNEANYIENLIDSISIQTVLPNEVIIVDGGSRDDTVKIIKEKARVLKKNNINVFVKKGNRSVGRNYAIKNAKYEIILITDAGCTLDKNWVKNIIKPFEDKKIDIVAGYYKGKHKNIFEKSLVPYVLVMPDKVNPKDFLPATRSMALRRNVWGKLKGFNERFSHNEDYEFANRLKENNLNIFFQNKAIAYWIPRQNLKQSFKMFGRFAYGDIESRNYRASVVLTFLRYITGIYLLTLVPIMKSMILNLSIILLLLIYYFWSVVKNYKYVKDRKAFIYLPLIQITADVAVITGSTLAMLRKYPLNFLKYLLQNKSLVLICIIYIAAMLSIISWGIPNNNHPFNYFMDEWHQSQSVRNLFAKGSPNIEGSANGSIFQFYLSGLYLIPFALTGIVKVFAIKSSISNLAEQFRLFEVLRINTIIFGVLSISAFYYLCKKYFRFPSVATILFVFNPIFLMLSNYFKYDIALIFWILISTIFLIRYANKPSLFDFLMSGIFSALAFATKLSVQPLLLIYVMAFFIFTKSIKQKLRWLVAGIFIYFLVFLVYGTPDILLGKGNLYEYLFSNLIKTPSQTENSLKISSGIWQFLFTSVYPSLFGFALYFGSLISLIVILATNTRKFGRRLLQVNPSITVILLLLFLFTLSFYPLKLGASNNRVLVLLPYLSILFVLGLGLVKNYKNKVFLIFVSAALTFQLIQAYSWVWTKMSYDPRHTSSEWIYKNIPKGSTIGIQNIPVYQSLPDVVVKEFYLKQYGQGLTNMYNYNIISSSNRKLPNTIILSNSDFFYKYSNDIEEKKLLSVLKNLGYKKIKQFNPDFRYIHLFTNDLEYYVGAIYQAPLSIDIYEKH